MDHAFEKTLALADAEISPAEVPALVQELARNPSLVRALQTYIAVGRRRLARPYDARREEPVPQWLIDTVMQRPAARTAHLPARAAAFGSSWLAHVRRRYRVPGWALAGPAFAALLVGVFAWQQWTQNRPLMTAQLQSALEHTAGGQSAQSDFLPLLTYWSKNQTWCRQFAVARSSSERIFAIACRDEGTWRVVMQTPPVATTGMAPAGSPRQHLDQYVTANAAGPSLEPSQLPDVVQSQWAQPARP